ncbi:MAG: hypothetical protein MR868_03745 [Lachnospiraceae bacterium]|nr:hypothetical protein [Lachnospiraceae bacterium]
MRKQTKIVAVASAAALLAIGASMTSFAATGWVEEDGQWYFYDKDGNRVENEWKKSGDNWYWLDSDENGAMAVDKLVEDDDDTYYVDANGVMVRNTWVKVVNEDQDDEEDPAEYNYYYMQSNGKAYKANDAGETKFKTIDGKKYAFDEDGKMLYGWLNTDATRATDESDWETATYYCGSWDDGSLKTGWQKIYVYDQDKDDDMDYWFNFKSNGKKRVFTDSDSDNSTILEKKINGKKYGFDARGVMVYEWTVATEGDLASTSTWKYFRSPEDGARVTKGWFKVVAPEKNDDTNTFEEYSGTFATTHSDDESEKWYYADEDGQLIEGEIKKIKGKYDGFRPDTDEKKGAAMLTGLCPLTVDQDGRIVKVWDEDIDSDALDDVIDGEGDFEGFGDSEFDTLYYFGNDEDTDGALKTGNVTLNLDGDTYQFQFSKTGGAEGKGRGLTGIDDEKYIYKYGKKMKADNDEKYIVVYATGDTADKDAVVNEIDSKDLRAAYEEAGTNKDGDTVKYVGTVGTTWGKDYYLVNTSGSIIKNKTAAKDGDDWYFYVDDKQIKMYTNNKTLKGDKDHTMTVNLDGWKSWKLVK